MIGQRKSLLWPFDRDFNGETTLAEAGWDEEQIEVLKDVEINLTNYDKDTQENKVEIWMIAGDCISRANLEDLLEISLDGGYGDPDGEIEALESLRRCVDRMILKIKANPEKEEAAA